MKGQIDEDTPGPARRLTQIRLDRIRRTLRAQSNELEEFHTKSYEFALADADQQRIRDHIERLWISLQRGIDACNAIADLSSATEGGDEPHGKEWVTMTQRPGSRASKNRRNVQQTP